MPRRPGVRSSAGSVGFALVALALAGSAFAWLSAIRDPDPTRSSTSTPTPLGPLAPLATLARPTAPPTTRPAALPATTAVRPATTTGAATAPPSVVRPTRATTRAASGRRPPLAHTGAHTWPMLFAAATLVAVGILLATEPHSDR